MEPFTILTALIPLLTEAGKAVVQRWITPDTFKPANVGDYIAMKNADVQLFQALNSAGGNNASYPWVEATIRLMRPAVVFAVLSVWCYVHTAGAIELVDTASIDNFAAAVGFYLFADRLLFYAKKAADK